MEARGIKHNQLKSNLNSKLALYVLNSALFESGGPSVFPLGGESFTGLDYSKISISKQISSKSLILKIILLAIQAT